MLMQCINQQYHLYVEQIMQAFNVTLNSGKFPKSWKDGITIPVYKQGNKLDVKITEESL